jgi:hypothetical protein
MLLLRENLSYDKARITLEHQEGENGTKNLFMKGIFIQGGVKNHNQRIYPVNEIQRAVNELSQQLIENNTIFGECDHPPELNINLERVSHMITEMYMDGNNGVGKLKILPTPMGNIVRTLLESGGKLGVSSRGSGNVDNGNVSDFEIVTVDIVARPSAPQAYPVPVYETRNGKRGKIVEDLAESVRHDPKAQKHLKKELLSWFDNLR